MKTKSTASEVAREALCWTVLCTCSGLVLFTAGGFFAPGLPVSWDGQAHLVRLLNMQRFLAAGSFYGWSFDWYNGFEPFLFYSPVFFIVTAATASVLGLTPLSALKAVAIVGWIVLPEAVYLAGRIMRFNRPEALIAGVLAIGVSTISGAGVEAVLATGLYVQVFALPIVAIALACSLRGVEDGGPWLPASALTIGTVLLIHTISAAALAAAAVVLFLVRCYERRGFDRVALKRLAFSWFGAAGVAGAVLLPMLVHWPLAGVPTRWGSRSYFSDFISGRLLPGMLPSVCAVLFVLIIKKRTPADRFIAVLLIVIFILSAGWMSAGIPAVDLRLEQFFKERALPYVGLVACFCAARFFAVALERLGAKLPPRTEPVVSVLCWTALAAFLSFSVVYRVIGRMPQPLVDSQDNRGIKQQNDAALAWLKANSEPHSLVAVDFRGLNPAEPGHARLQARTVLIADRPALPGSQIESTRNPSWTLLKELHSADPLYIEERLVRHGVSYVMTSSADAAANLRRIGRLTDMLTNQAATIFRVNGVEPVYINDSSSSISSFSFAEEDLVWDLERPSAGRVSFPISYHPYWHAQVNGEPAQLAAAADNLLELNLPAGKVRLELQFVHPLWRTMLPVVSAASILLLLALLVRRRPISE